MENLHYFILLALLAEILGTVGGFGSSLFFIPIASYFLDFHSALGITAIFHITSNISKIALFKNGIDKKLIISLGIPAVIFVIIGAVLTNYFETKLLEIILGFFLIVISLMFLLFDNIQLRPTLTNSIGGGVISGLLAGLLGTGGAIRGITLAAFGLSMEVFIATSAVIDLAIDVSRSVVYAVNGFVHKDDLYLIPLLAVVSILGTSIGKRILTRFSQDQFKKIVLVAILCLGIYTLIKFFVN